ncbi:MAG: four helix bundle protein [Bacteroidales bacterium]|nr:four helix bundle protein [Bacteroidales bacterium]
MSTITRFEDLEIWKLARELCKIIFKITQKSEIHRRESGLRNQISIASGSIMDNIAEGFEREGNKELIQFLTIAKGSAGEVQSQLYRLKDFGYISNEEFEETLKKAKTISGSIANFIKYLKQSELKGNKFKKLLL